MGYPSQPPGIMGDHLTRRGFHATLCPCRRFSAEPREGDSGCTKPAEETWEVLRREVSSLVRKLKGPVNETLSSFPSLLRNAPHAHNQGWRSWLSVHQSVPRAPQCPRVHCVIWGSKFTPSTAGPKRPAQHPQRCACQTHPLHSSSPGAQAGLQRAAEGIHQRRGTEVARTEPWVRDVPHCSHLRRPL